VVTLVDLLLFMLVGTTGFLRSQGLSDILPVWRGTVWICKRGQELGPLPHARWTDLHVITKISY